MNDPLTSINAEEVEKNVMDAYKTMHKSVKIFNEIPSMYVARVCARAHAVSYTHLTLPTTGDV